MAAFAVAGDCSISRSIERFGVTTSFTPQVRTHAGVSGVAPTDSLRPGLRSFCNPHDGHLMGKMNPVRFLSSEMSRPDIPLPQAALKPTTDRSLQNSVQPTIHIHIPDSNAKIMPDKKERDLWWAFLAGRPESEWNPPKKPKQPKLSRWQQHNLKKAAREFGDEMREASLPYDVGSSTAEQDVTSNASHMGPHGPDGILDRPPSHGVSAVQPSLDGVPSGEVDEVLAYTPREPTPILFQHIDHVRRVFPFDFNCSCILQRYAIHLLMYFGHWINVRLEGGTLPHTDLAPPHARWMFSLLSRVDDWISGDETSLLRNLARSCVELIAERRRKRSAAVSTGVEASDVGGGGAAEDAAQADESSFWMVVAAIAGVWGQRDLWADAEGILSRVPSPASERIF